MVRDAVRLETGWAVLLDSPAPGLVLVDPSGGVRHRVGGRGSGPGEFRELRVLQRAGAGVAVLDNGNRRYSEYVVDADTLALAREVPVELIADDFCLLGDELFLLSAQNGRLVEVLGLDGSARRGFGELPPQEHISERFRRSVQATVAGGRIACVPHREMVIVAYRLLPDVLAFSPSGEALWQATPPHHRATTLQMTADGTGYTFATDHPSGVHQVTVAARPLGDTLLVQWAVLDFGHREPGGREVDSRFLRLEDGEYLGGTLALPVLGDAAASGGVALSNDPFPRAALFTGWALEEATAGAAVAGSDEAAGFWTSIRELGPLGGSDGVAGPVAGVSGGALVGRLAVVVLDPTRGLLRFPLAGGDPLELWARVGAPEPSAGADRAGLLPTGEAWVALAAEGVVHMVGGDGTGGRVLNPAVEPFDDPPGPGRIEAMLSDGSFLVRPTRLHAPESEPWQPRPHPLVRVDRDGRVVDTLLAPPSAHLPELRLPVPGHGRVTIGSLLAEDPLLAVHPRGEAVGLLHRTQGLEEGAQGWIHLAVPGSDGVQRTSFPVPGAALLGGKEAVERRARRYLSERGGAGTPDATAFVAAVLDAFPAPSWISPVQSYSLDSDGRHWVGAEGPEDSLEWRRGTPDGNAWTPIPFPRPVRRIIDARSDLVVVEMLGVDGRWGVAVLEGGAGGN